MASGSYDNSVSATVTFGVSKNVWKSSINGLSPATIYYYRIAANDSYPGYTTDTAYGSEKSFTTLAVTPTVRATVTMTPTVVLTPRTTPLLTPTMTPMATAAPSPTPTVTPCGDISTDEATDVTSNSATLNATVCIGITAGQIYFEYGKTSGTYTNSIDTRRDDLLNNVYARISGLSTVTTYYYRIVVVQKGTPFNPTGYTYGEEKFFVTLSETSSPTVTPTPLCEVESVSVLPKRLILKRGKSHEVTVNLKGKNDCSTEGKIITATIGKIGSKRISVTPANQAADENGQAVFTITAVKIGTAKVIFKVDSTKKSVIVRVVR